MYPTNRDIEGFLASLGVAFERNTAAETKDIAKLWLQTYAAQVKSATGAWINDSFRWHGFTHGHQTASEGPDAMQAYQSQWSAPYIIFDEALTWSYHCTSSDYPDLSPLGADLYVSHRNMKWTMVFTHEQPDMGPFFALKTENAVT